MTEQIRVSGDRLKELKQQFPFLEELINSIDHPITGIKVKDKKDMPTGSALEFHADSGYEYDTNIYSFDSIVVHEYITDEPPKGNPDCELVIYTP